ncbi:MAG: biotin--[acetyl-CoA-carboxylase] ligase [Alphaproteobacteria bacterium]|nr:biotin--[acetyl-CoA-carboxylase] ligase [Alphaproteobacteria bacterium]
MTKEYLRLAGYKVLSFDKISSTQTYAHDMIAQGKASDRIAIVAAAQYAGRGRYRRKWVSHHGNLYVSFIFHCPERDPRLSYAVAVAIAETVISFGISPLIKWPNDILIDNAKVAGALIEYAGRFVIVGIGINVHTNPTVPEYKTTRLDKYNDIELTDLMSRLVKNLDRFINADFDLVRKRWMELAAGLNKLVKYRGEMVELIGVNDNGALVVRRGSEYLLIHGDEILM